ncbi:MAG: glycerate kinase type-2 family protein [Acidimicrobiia bacterium]
MSHDQRALLLAAFEAAVRACDPEAATMRALKTRSLRGSVRVIAIGKASPGMARGATEVLGEQIVGGVVVSDHIESVPDALSLMIGSHPVPDHRSLVAGDAVLKEAERTDHDHLLVLVSGGGSALAEVPRARLGAAQLADTTALLMDAGVPIGDVNTVRRHLSELKDGGVLRRSLVPVTTLLISDVVDGPAAEIASGPTLVSGSTSTSALRVLEEAGLAAQADRKVLDLLRSDRRAHTSNAPHDWEVIVDRFTAMRGARDHLTAAGFRARTLEQPIEGPAAATAIDFVRSADSGVTVASGETTVQITGEGIGGRNQHAALAAAVELAGREDFVFGALGTDGIDGPTDAAGAIVDGLVAGQILAAGIDPADAVVRCDSHGALEASTALVRTGPTGTNVGDIWMVSRL